MIPVNVSVYFFVVLFFAHRCNYQYVYTGESFVQCDHPAEVRWACPPTTKSGSVVKADNDTHIPRGHEKLYYSRYETFRGIQGGPEMSRERAGRGDWLGVFVWLEGGGG